jgi:hypothetical protein
MSTVTMAIVSHIDYFIIADMQIMLDHICADWYFQMKQFRRRDEWRAAIID